MKIRRWQVAIAMVPLSYVTYHAGLFLHVLIILMGEAQGSKYGGAVARADSMRAQYPVQFELVQSITRLPIPNYGAYRYFKEQSAIFAEAALKFELHPYWADTHVASEPIMLRTQLHERVKSVSHGSNARFARTID